MYLAKCTERNEELDIPCILATIVVIIVVDIPQGLSHLQGVGRKDLGQAL